MGCPALSLQDYQFTLYCRVQVPKSRKAVDRRASKGRKVRYHVMPKLVNFMVPVEDKYPEADDRISALFTNLFGQQSQT